MPSIFVIGERATNGTTKNNEETRLVRRIFTIDDEVLLKIYEVLLPDSKARRVDDQAWEVTRSYRPLARLRQAA
ncbi:hypothetical protein KEM48_012158 [Puccinia striiformis f. sp. tritici PST-130]|nr:hypothetical protein H4Q26_013092 [Puccinia striiformis f. sp. tritici PST-130]KAI9630129.1 hypothetical protein KEM48_012158 [Puccinia striiformis f. sp. tritici PST-130]